MQLIYGDCLEHMKNIPDKSIDFICVDPPYGLTQCKWDSVVSFKDLWADFERIIKPNNAIAIFGAEPFSSLVRTSNLNIYRYDWVWDKHIARGMFQAKYQPMRKHEIISVFSLKYPHNYYPIMVKREKTIKSKNYINYTTGTTGKFRDNSKTYEYSEKYPVSILVDLWEANRGKIHPTQKPVSLLEYLIKTYTLENETVLDCFMGSGTTGVACKNLNRNFIGIEKDENYYKLAVQRING